MDAQQAEALRRWTAGLRPDTRATLHRLATELCGGMDSRRHNDFGFLRLRAEFETSGEIFGCSLEELRDALAEPQGSPGDRPKGVGVPDIEALEALRRLVATQGHPDFRRGT